MTINVTGNSASQTVTIELDPVGTSTGSVTGALVYLQVTDATTGDPVTTSCFVLIDFSNEGCDENGDGRISFEDVPPGVYGVTQTVASPGYLTLKDFRINVHDDKDTQTFPITLTPSNQTTGTVDVAVVPYDATTGGVLTGACVQFEGASLVGCDENGDGKITFAGVPVGSYQLSETQAPPGYDLAKPRIVSVQQDGRFYYIEHYPASNVATLDLVDVAIVTRDPDDGTLLNGACYIIIDASIEGCDENNDGQVDFAGVVPGTYTLHQTNAPSGFNRINDFAIQISQYDPTQSILTKQSADQFAPGYRNVSVAVWDINTGQRIRGENVCVQLSDWSNVGCDLNSDGQIDFQDVPVGEYQINVTSLPAGYVIYFDNNVVEVDSDNPFSIANALLTVEGP